MLLPSLVSILSNSENEFHFVWIRHPSPPPPSLLSPSEDQPTLPEYYLIVSNSCTMHTHIVAQPSVGLDNKWNINYNWPIIYDHICLTGDKRRNWNPLLVISISVPWPLVNPAWLSTSRVVDDTFCTVDSDGRARNPKNRYLKAVVSIQFPTLSLLSAHGHSIPRETDAPPWKSTQLEREGGGGEIYAYIVIMLKTVPK